MKHQFPFRLQYLWEQGQVSDVDLHFADLMRRMAGQESESLLLAAALASHACGEGHVCLQLGEWGGRRLGSNRNHRQQYLPQMETWMAELRRCPVVAAPPEEAPLILDQGGRLYLYRYWLYEQALAEALRERSDGEVELLDAASLRAGLDALFPLTPEVDIDWQRIAATVAVLKRLTVITGGPGTGKTSTVVRILALLQQQAGQKPLNIALAAPTGKAAARLQASIRQAKATLPLAASLLEMIPEQAMTLHRLLGSRPDSIYFRHDAANPLPLDLLVIDEASMVDLALMAKVVAALPNQARLILLGDRDQLSSVEAGAVLGDICAGQSGFSHTLVERIQTLGGIAALAEGCHDQPLSDVVVELKHSYRFDRHSGIGRLARAFNQGKTGEALTLLAESQVVDLCLLGQDADPLEIAETGYREYLQRIAGGGDPGQVFQAFDRFRVLCALRGGPHGVEQMNRAITDHLRRVGLLSNDELWFTGRPLLITRNDYGLKLYNGDIGILLPDDTGRKQVLFPTAEGFRWVAPARLPPHETAFAMTVHKSQGSEFDRVLLVMPEVDSPLLTRELVYTGLTRCREYFILHDRKRLLASAIKRRTRRHSGLREMLWREAVGTECDPGQLQDT